ncbi:MAG: AsmA-like C-terminal region-containing protein [Thermoleophilia bacterium]|nr:AsmA-like C-terminal region-containing protein [Thermoleophilia bacterium]
MHLRARSPDDDRMAFDLSGEVDLGGPESAGDFRTELKMTPIDLAAITAARLPTGVREVWEQLHLRGSVAGTALRFTPESGMDITITLADVSLNAPIASGRAEITGSRPPRMEGVAGTLRLVQSGPSRGLHADMRGLFEDLPARVRFDSRALSLDAEYGAVVMADRFQLEKDPRILWFAPEVVHRNFERFSGPTAVVDARIEVNRRPPLGPGLPGETSIAGTLVFENGSAAYEVFPYPMTALSGTVRFSDDEVRIVGIRGRGPTGARLFAEGTIDTSTAQGGYDIRVTATDVPIDSTLRAALLASPGAPMVDAVFSQKRLDELVAGGLVAVPGLGPGAGPGVPRFDLFSGTVDSIQVHVLAWGQKEAEPVIHQDIAVRFRDVNALPEMFPYPLKGTDVSVRIGDDAVVAHGENVTGLYGGAAEFDARIDVLPADDAMNAANGGSSAWRYRPTLRIRTERFPIEPVLINALPDAAAGPSAGGPGGAFSIKEFLLKLGLNGPVDAAIDVTPGGRGIDQPSVAASILFDKVTAAPEHPGDPGSGLPLAIDSLIGAITASSTGVSIDSLEGTLAPRQPDPALVGPLLGARFRIDGEWSFAGSGAPAAPGKTDLALAVADLDARLAVEDLLRLFSPSAAERVLAVRRDRDPSGRVDLTLSVKDLDRGGRGLGVTASVSKAGGLAVTVAGQRAEIVQEGGSLTARLELPEAASGRPPPPARIDLDRLSAQLRIDGEPMGSLSVSGEFSPPTEGSAGGAGTPLLVFRPLEAELRGVRLESPVTRRLAERLGGESVGEVVARYTPEGLIDGEVRLTLPGGAADPARWEPTVTLRPRWLALTLGEGDDRRRVLLPLISGEAHLDRAGGVFDELTVLDEGLLARFNGRWRRGPADGAQGPALQPGGWSVDGLLNVETQGLPPALLALLPPSIESGLSASRVQLLGELTVPNASVRVWNDAGEEGAPEFAVAGSARVTGLFADPGLSVHDAAGEVRFSSARSGGGPAETRLELDGASMRIAGLRLVNASGRLTLPGDGTARVPDLQGEAYGGRLFLEAQSGPRAGGGGGRGAYSGALKLAGVRFADVLRDLERNSPVGGGPLPPLSLAPAPPEEPAPDGSRGLIEAQLSVSGTTGEDASRSGRGEVRIAGGRAVLELPGLTPVLSLAAMQFPTSSPFDFAHADVHLVNGTLYFDDLVILSDALALLGAGSVGTDGRRLDLHMVARGRSKVPLLTDLLDSFRDELVTARVLGSLAAPRVSLENFSAVRSVFGGRANPLSQALRVDLDRLERDRQRTLGVSGPVAGRPAPRADTPPLSPAEAGRPARP